MRFALIITFVCTCAIEVWATHIIGGNFEVEQTGRNNFLVRLKLFRDPSGVQVNVPVTFRVYNRADSTDFTDVQVHDYDLTVPEIGDDCFKPSQLRVEEYTFVTTISLQDNPDGYLFVARVCCRNDNIDNIVSNGSNVGMTWTAEIPDPAFAEENSSPNLGPYPSQGFFCFGQLRELDLSATDPDGDSLSYALVAPIGSPNPAPIHFPPYSSVRWRSGYSMNNIIGGSPALSIDPVTGILTSKPDKIGIFVFSYIVSEYRNGIKIGEVRRDVQFESLDCIYNKKPAIIKPESDHWTLNVSDRFCRNIEVSDTNASDSVYLRVTYKNLSFTPVSSSPNFSNNVYGQGGVNGIFCWTPDCGDAFRKSSFSLHIYAYSFGCDVVDTVYKEVKLEVIPQEENFKNLIPNVFTPNNDGLNDYFSLGFGVDELPCLESLNFKVFNRWGTLVYETNNTKFKWDGTFQGKPLQQGVYFYIMQGQYGNSSFEIKDFLNLL